VGPWGTRYAAVWFSDNGNILAVRNGNDGDTLDIGDYTLGQWCQITLKADLLLKTFDVYINGHQGCRGSSDPSVPRPPQP